MTELFYTILNMSISASVLVLVVLLLRLLFRKAPKWVAVLLWGLVAVRLLCPFALETPFSLMPKTEWITEDTSYNNENTNFDSVAPEHITPDPNFADNVNVHYYPLEPHIEIHRGVNPVFVLNCVWLAGIAVMLVYMFVSYICVYRRIRGAKQFKDNIYTSEAVSSPFVLGLIRPRIYLPEKMDAVSMSYVIAHEEAHLRRLDHLWKPIGFLLLAVHWFNPLIWIGYILLCRDIEMACDERVVRTMNDEERFDYSEALLACSVSRKMITACPLAFGEVGAKERIMSVLNYKKPAFWIIVAALIACAAAAVFFLTNPIDQGDPIDEENSYFMMIEEEGIAEIRVSTPINSGGCIHADNSLFKSGEKVWLENLNHIDDLRGVEIAAISESGETVYSVTFPESATNMEIEQLLLQTEWFIPPESISMKYTTVKEGSENIIASNISERTLTYWVLKGHQEEIWAYRNTAINDTVDETFRKWGERIAAVGVNDERNCVDVYVYDFDEGDIGRFKKALGHLSYVLIQKDDVIEMIPDEQKQLTLEDVIELSAKGQDLTWEDFHEFKSRETGSGLYIRLYEIDEIFSVWIGGGSPVTTPMYIYLSANGLDNRIDIREGGVEEFIENAAPRYEIENIIFHSERGGESEALERFYSDDKYDYYFPTIRNYVVIVYFKDGTEQTVKEALAEGKITINDLDLYEIEYYADAKAETDESYVTQSSQKNIADLFAEIESAPTYSSNPKDYIDAHPDEYTKLIEYGNHTLVYVFNEFLAGGQTGLHGHILCSVMLELLNENEIIKYDPTNGQDYFDQWLASARAVQKQHDPVWLEVNVPSIALVLKMAGDISTETYVDQTEVDPDPVDTAISRALNQHYRDDEPTGLLHGISYVLLANETVSGTPRFGQTNHIEKEIYYLLVMHQKYSMQNGQPTAIGGSYIPTVLTFTKEDNGEYILDEYWEPRDGAYYDDDIKAKFPAGVIDEVWNMDAYSEKLEKQCADDVFVYVDNYQAYTEPGDL